MPLTNLRPYLIQRCTFDEDKLRYDYMGSTEFELGDQGKCLREMFKGEPLDDYSVRVPWRDKMVDFRLVAPGSFDFRAYAPVLLGLAKNEWPLKEGLYLDRNMEWLFTPPAHGKEQQYMFCHVDAWFDFANGVFFTYTKNKARKLIRILNDLKAELAKPDPAEVVQFKVELEKLKPRLNQAGKYWFSLDRVRLVGDKPMVWLNPMDQRVHDCGWFSIADLEQWLADEGPIMISRSVRR